MTTKLCILGAVALAFGIAANVRGEEPNKVQSRAMQYIETNAKRITKLAYVSSKSHTKLEYVKGLAYPDGSFDLTYKFFYRDSDNDPQTYTLRFQYSSTGQLTGAPATVHHSSFWEPFNAITMANEIAKELQK